MTKEEIIHRLQYARHRIDNITFAPDVLKAIDIAIEAVGNTDSDTISRQAAIEALDEQIEQCDKALSSFDISMKDGYAVKVERASLVAFREILEYLPPAQPQIIRCKDCRHFEYNHVENVNGIPLIVAHEICMRWGDGVKTSENGYCFLAERREVTT